MSKKELKIVQLRKVRDSRGDFWFALGDLLEILGLKRGKASRFAEKLPPKYIQKTEIPDFSGTMQDTLLAHSLAAIQLVSSEAKGEHPELISYLSEPDGWMGVFEGIDLVELETSKTTREVDENGTLQIRRQKIIKVNPVETHEEQVKKRNVGKRMVASNGEGGTCIVTRLPSGIVRTDHHSEEDERIQRLKESAGDHCYNASEGTKRSHGRFIYTDDKGQLRDRNTGRIVTEAELKALENPPEPTPKATGEKDLPLRSSVVKINMPSDDLPVMNPKERDKRKEWVGLE